MLQPVFPVRIGTSRFRQVIDITQNWETFRAWRKRWAIIFTQQSADHVQSEGTAGDGHREGRCYDSHPDSNRRFSNRR